MNRTVIRLTARGMLGGRRILLVAALAVVVIGLAVIVRAYSGEPLAERDVAEFMQPLALAAIMPLFGLIVGTGAIGPEIDDGSIIHLLSKPVSRASIVHSKLLVAVTVTVLFAVLPIVAATLIFGGPIELALAIGVGAFAAGAVYSVLFMLLAILTRHAVLIGLVYALLWEGLIGSLMPGAREISVRQWALSVTDSLAQPGIFTADVGLVLAVSLIIAGVVVGTWYAGNRLSVLTLASDD